MLSFSSALKTKHKLLKIKQLPNVKFLITIFTTFKNAITSFLSTIKL